MFCLGFFVTDLRGLMIIGDRVPPRALPLRGPYGMGNYRYSACGSDDAYPIALSKHYCRPYGGRGGPDDIRRGGSSLPYRHLC
jgi:hypothetical protein